MELNETEGGPRPVQTRVRTLIDYLEAGDEHAVAALELAKQMLASHANPA